MSEKIVIKLEGDSTGINKALKKTDQQINKTEKSADNLAKSFGAVKVVGVAAIAAIGVVAVKAIKDFSRFENELLGVKTLLNENSFGAKGLEKGFADMTDKVKDLGSRVPVDIGAMNKALFDTISAGVDAGEAVGVLETSAKLAVAGLTDVATATDGMTSALNAYGLGADQAETVASKFFAAQVAGKTTIAELSDGFGKVGATASSFGVSLDEILAATSAVTTAGIKTNAAYTGLNAVFSNIAKPTADAAKEAKRLGIEFNTTSLRSKGLKGFLTELTQAQGFNQKSIEKLFGSVEAQKIAFSLTGQQASNFNDNLVTLSDTQGTLNTLTGAYNTQVAGSQNQMDILSNKVKILSVNIGESLAPALTVAVDLLSKMFPKEYKTEAEALEASIAKLQIRIQKLNESSFGGDEFMKTETLKSENAKLQKLLDERQGIKDKAIGKDEERQASAHGAALQGQEAAINAQNQLDEQAASEKAAKEDERQSVLNTQKLEKEKEYQALRAEAQAEIDELATEKDLTELQLLENKLEAKAKIEELAKTDKLAKDKKFDKAIDKIQTANDKRRLAELQKQEKAKTDYESLSQSQRTSNLQTTFGNIARLSKSENKALFAIGKAAALAQATIDAYAAHNIALRSAPAPFNIALAALTDISSAAAIAGIAGIKGFANGGMVTGGVPGVDSVPIMAQQGELVVPRQNFDEVIDSVAASRGGGTGGSTEIVLTMNENLIDFVEAELQERQALEV